MAVRRPAATAAAALALAAVAASCAAPRITLTPRLPDGEVRRYELVAEARTVTDLPVPDPDDHTVLRARVEIRIGRDAGRPAATLTLTPTAFRRNGRAGEVPPPQTATVAFDEAGRVESVRSDEGEALPFGGSADDVGTIFGSTIARGRVRLADRWSEPIAPDANAGPAAKPGLRRSRVAALRWVGGRRCAIVESAISREARRARSANGTTLELTGTEVAAVTTAFAFDAGLPVSVRAIADGRYTVAGAPQPGTVTIRSTTTMTLASGR